MSFTIAVRLHRYDSDPTTDQATTFIPLPVAGLAYSWRKQFKLNFLTTPVGTISNLRLYSDGVSWGTGVTVYVAVSPTYFLASPFDAINQIDGAVVLTTKTVLSPLVVNAGVVLSNPAVGYGIQSYVMIQVSVDHTALEGIPTPRALTYVWDET